MTGNAALIVEDLRAGYGGVPILHGIGLSVSDGEIAGILGHNGMGKSTLLKTLMGLIDATGGSIHFAGADITRKAAHERARSGIGYVPQGRGIFPALTVLDNLRMGLAAHGGNQAEAIAGCLRDFPRLRHLLDRDGAALSGGAQQLLAIARCLIANPKLMLLDEPTEGIQPSIVDELIETIRRLQRERGIAIVLVEQNLEFILELSDRVLMMQKGQISGEIAGDDTANAALIDAFTGFGVANLT